MKRDVPQRGVYRYLEIDKMKYQLRGRLAVTGLALPVRLW